MTEKKFEKIIVALTVGAVLLVMTLLTIMVYQLISISVAKKDSRELDAQIAEYNMLISVNEDIIEAHSKRLWIELRARQLGLVGANDIDLNSK